MGTKKAKYFELTFPDPAEEPEPAEDIARDKALKKWQTDGLGRQSNWNFEVFRAQKLSILVPDDMLLQPFMSIKVYERPSAGMLQRAGLTAEEEVGALIGEHRVSLNEHFPCVWFKGIDLRMPYDEQEETIRLALKEAVEKAAAKKFFHEETEED